ncbi:TetR/AcrR family transcriptional regulator [Microbacterium sp. No. 7]|uniref:TetR/AcrR family transcriptional regulator n=1 Tax=Microbacterium sp. No. 7 TaxID=1714373 RepID=UPI0006D2A638|nr:TetR family transcriptional regulator [Microbacterium sp. No. 7]ALJ18700.1 hypothetical protein AOA12_01745 [Microbacterium sp. No. 7]
MSTPVDRVPPGRHDPEGRRRQIVRAAADLITEAGIARVTHRLVAERAGVSLGSTTRYFATLDELIECALAQLSDDMVEQIDALRALLQREGCTPEVLARYLHDFVADAESVRIACELVSASLSDPALRPIAQRWGEDVTALLAEFVGATAARGIVMLMDGATVQAATEGVPDEALLCALIAAVMTAR